MAFILQKETRYVIEKGGAFEWSVHRVVDTIEEVIAICASAIDMDECEDEWNDFISGKSRTFSYEDRWKITCCKKSES
jgi:hypothetical protein